MASDPSVITTQPNNQVHPSDTTTVHATTTTPPATSQQSTADDKISYASSDAHAQQFYCGCMRCCKECANGDDERWYYPWDKGPLCCVPLGCGWCLVGLLFPCCLCIPSCRNIICCVDEGAWSGTCFGACICGLPRTGRKRSNSEDSD